MSPAALENHIVDLLKPLLARDRMKLCGVKVGGSPRRPMIQVFIDLEDAPIPIGRCAGVSRELQTEMDLQVWAPQNYRLIVSSPGLDWPLTEEWQFRKNIGRSIRRTGGDRHVEGVIGGINKDGRVLLNEQGKESEFAIDELAGAKVVIQFTGHAGSRRKIKK